MSAFDLIRELRGAGVVLHADGGTLDISPVDRLTDEMIEALKQHKFEILALLKNEDAQLFENAAQPKPRQNRQEWKPDRCNRCIHLCRFTGGNACRTDNGLPHLFGRLYNVPEDQGADCASWQADRWETLCPTDWLQ